MTVLGSIFIRSIIAIPMEDKDERKEEI